MGAMSKIDTQLLEGLNEYMAFARKRLSDPELAVDAVQDSLLKALKRANQIRDEKNVKAWFYSILRRTIIDLYRKHDVRERLAAQMDQVAGWSEEDELAVCNCMNQLIPTLRPQYATVLQRVDLDGEAPESVAATLGITTNNLNVRLHRARKQLKRRLLQTCGMCAKHGCLNCTCETTCS